MDPTNRPQTDAPYAQETINTPIGKLSFTHDFANGYPTKETIEKLYDERDFQRATQAYLWALPMVSIGQLEGIYTANGAAYGDLMVLEGFGGVSHFTTPNTTTPYVFAWFNLAKTGPWVVEVPPGPTANVALDLWQRGITDMGVPGPDKGKGGKYLFLGPGQEAPTGADGYLVVRSSTANMVICFRLLAPEAQERQGLLEAVRVYPYSQRDNAPKNRILRPRDDDTVNNAPRGLTYWEKLARWINEEPVQERDRIMRPCCARSASKRASRSSPMRARIKILTDATLVGEAMAKANDFDKRNMELAHYADGVQWEFAIVLHPSQEAEYYTQVDERAAWFYEACGMSEGMVTKTPGVGSVYLGSSKDKAGDWLDGKNSYRLRVPANAPIQQFWALTVYDVNTRSLIQNEQKMAERSSRQPDLVKNADGSVDIYVGPNAPAGFEKNWIPSVPGKAWFAYFRLYAPTEAHFNGTWVLPDFEKLH